MGLRAFRPEDQVLFANFNCGHAHFQTELVEYISGPEVLEEIEDNAEVFLITDDANGRIAAFGSLLVRTWEFSTGLPIQLIEWSHLAVDVDYLGNARDERGLKYSRALFEEMTRRTLRMPPLIVGLYVHKDNWQAKSSYLKTGFQLVEEDLIDGEYERMMIGKSSLPVPPAR